MHAAQRLAANEELERLNAQSELALRKRTLARQPTRALAL